MATSPDQFEAESEDMHNDRIKLIAIYTDYENISFWSCTLTLYTMDMHAESMSA